MFLKVNRRKKTGAIEGDCLEKVAVRRMGGRLVYRSVSWKRIMLVAVAALFVMQVDVYADGNLGLGGLKRFQQQLKTIKKSNEELAKKNGGLTAEDLERQYRQLQKAMEDMGKGGVNPNALNPMGQNQPQQMPKRLPRKKKLGRLAEADDFGIEVDRDDEVDGFEENHLPRKEKQFHRRVVLDKMIEDAIKRLQDYLISKQKPNGSFDVDYTGKKQEGGETALVIYALLSSGMSAQEPSIARGLKWLNQVDMKGTYARALRMHCYAYLPMSYRGRLEKDARWLLNVQKDSLFGYTNPRGGRLDHSLTQYGVLGLWEYSKRGGGTTSHFWNKIIEYFKSRQNEDGGWGDQPRDNSTDSMTAAGLTAMLVAQECSLRSRVKANESVQEVIRKGLTWLDAKAYANGGLVGGSKMYDLVSLERVALACGVKTFGGRDWFDAGAEHILQKMSSNGSNGNFSDTAFMLLFLSRGHVPVWINKLKVTDHIWNQRPNDIHILTRWISENREQEQNWQVVSVDSNPEEWLNAPAMWLSTEELFEFDGQQLENLEYYINMGGMLIVNPECRKLDFFTHYTAMFEGKFKHAKWMDMPSNHPMLNLLKEVNGLPKRKIRVLNNGVRDLVILLPNDWGMYLQWPNSEIGFDPGKAMMNLYAVVTGRGRMNYRLSSPLVYKEKQVDVDHKRMMVIRASYDGEWGHEPNALHAVANMIYNSSGIELVGMNLPIEQIHEYPKAFVRLTGTDVITLSEAQLQSIDKFVKGGGTMLVETIGGCGEFSLDLLKQLTRYLEKPSLLIEKNDPIINGTKMEGGYDVRHCRYRHFTQINMGLRDVPRVTAICVEGRPAILFSHQDISMGALGVRHWGINGYETKSARELMCNMLLASLRRDRLKMEFTGEKKKEVMTPFVPRGISELLSE